MKYRTETEILLELINKSEEKNLITTNEELITQIAEGKDTQNQYVLLLSAISYLLAQLEEENQENQNNINLNTAQGEALDTLGLLVNVARYPAQPALCEITINVILPQEEDIIIPAGTLVDTDETMNYYGTYQTREEIIIPAGTQTINTIIESTALGSQNKLPANTATKLIDIPQVTITNEKSGTNGRNIEEDDEYRERIRQWPQIHSEGTKNCIEEYLDQYTGVDDYNLIPRYDGVGTLKIICDTLENMTDQIAQDVYDNCMLFTDKIPLVILPEITEVECKIKVTLKENNLTLDEMLSRIRAQTNIYINGGTLQDGTNIKGLHIGESLNPMELILHLINQLNFLSSAYITDTNDNLITSIPCQDEKILNINITDVVIV